MVRNSLAYLLVTLSPEGDLLSVLHALVHMDFQDFGLLVDFRPTALLAAILLINSLPCKQVKIIYNIATMY